MQAILALNPPNNVKELRHFLGMVQYYRDMWARRSEMLAPLTDLMGECRETKTTRMNKTKKKPWRWDLIHQQAFDNVKAAMAKETVLAYPDFLKPFEIYTDASSMQLGVLDIPSLLWREGLSNLGMEFLSRNTPSNLAGTH